MTDDLRERLTAVRTEVAKAVVGQEAAVSGLIVALLARGHVLLEGVPGVAKTLLVRSLSASLALETSRVQFTPDLMPGDVTGSTVFDAASGRFDFRPGPVFTNLLLADEINRTPPKTQSALLEAMEERQVTVDGTTYRLASPFSVVATQNPFEMEGTYALPEAQRDRFMARISMGYPDPAAELAMVQGRDADNPFDDLSPVASVDDITTMIAMARAIHVASSVERYVVDIVQATRTDPDLRLGASPRATLQLIRAAKARAAVQGRDFVLPDDIDALVPVVLPHRLIAMRGVSSVEDVVARIVAETPVPAGAVQRG